MVDFRKKLGNKSFDKKVNPINIYDSLDRRSDVGPLRPAQEHILEEWYENHKKDKDLIIKLNTGQGKTLIGLLILQSRLNNREGPCLYICPNKYLVDQTRKEAQKFGIKCCTFTSKDIPEEFLNSKAILITHVQKVFNGKTVFGLDNQSVETHSIILDDSHSCIESIQQAFTINIGREHKLYDKILRLFEEELKEQGQGTFLEVEDGEYGSILPVSYWAWDSKSEQVLKLLHDHKHEKEIMFTWPLIKDKIYNCQCFISGRQIEISTHFNPIHKFKVFENASQRILMSATTQNDSFFIKGLSLERKSIENPLTYLNKRWFGEKMILIPSLINEKLDPNFIITKFCKFKKLSFGVAVLVPSYKKAKHYKNLDARIAKRDDIHQVIQDLKNEDFSSNPIVMVNRYDGIDLPDNACRILIIDSLPYSELLSEKHEESCRPNSEIISTKIAQKIEQGLGRSVRGEKDYSVIILIRGNLVRFVKSRKTQRFFSPQTKKQIEIGLEIADMAKEEVSEKVNIFNPIKDLLNKSIGRDEPWRQYYSESMDSVDKTVTTNKDFLDILELERDAEKAFFIGNYEDATKLIQEIIDNYCTTDSDRGWYLQIKAMYEYYLSKTESNKLQKAAFNKNLHLLKPRDGVNYKSLTFINENRIKRIKESICKYDDFDELMLSINQTLDDFSFGTDSEVFEKAFQEIGRFLGFLSQRPDKEFKKGPDNLWCGVDNEYFLFECKNEMHPDRDEINKREASQMNTHCTWFCQTYGEDKSVSYYMIATTKKIAYSANLQSDVKIIRKRKLKEFKSNIKAFIKEFKNYNIKEISDKKIQGWIDIHKLDIESLKGNYSESFTEKK